jgi:hypothetical protein
MSDEQTMYIEPEDDVTTVRERLRQTANKQITLVIPPQSQLRSHLTWRLLYTRARELGKEVLIVSSDPQIRSLAHAVKFRVAHSLESSAPVGKSRPVGRMGRSAPPKSRIPSSRPASPQDLPEARSKGTGAGTNASAGNNRPIRGISGTNERGTGKGRNLVPPTPTPPLELEQPWYSKPTPSNPDLETPQIEDLGANDAITGGASLFGPPPSELQERPYSKPSQPFNFRSQTTPPIYPLPSDDAIEEPDPLFEDYHLAQDIRQAASEGRKRSKPAKSSDQPALVDLSDRFEQTSQPPTGPDRTTSHPRIQDDPFSYMEDSQPPHRSEQRAGAMVEGFDTREAPVPQEPVIEDVPTKIIDNSIEFRGDRDDIVPPRSSRPITTYAKPEDEKTQERDPSRVRNLRPRNSRNLPPPPARTDRDDEALPPANLPPARIRRSTPLQPQTPAARTSGTLAGQRISGRPSGAINPNNRPPAQGQRTSGSIGSQGQRTSGPIGSQGPRALATGSGAMAGSNRPGQAQPPLIRPASRSGRSGTGTTPLASGTRPGQPRAAGAPSRVGTGRRAATPARQRSNRRAYIWLVIAVVAIITLALTAYYGPSTSITLTVKTQDYTNNAITVKASVAQPGKPTPALAAEPLTKEFTKTGTGNATGTQNVGTQAASGIVFFTNNDDKTDIVIPSGVTLTTAGNPKVEFVTVAEGLVQHNSTLPISIQASKSGTAGNVDANTVVVIPPESLQKIAQAQSPQIAAGDLKLTVKNPDKIAGGGAKPVKVVADADLTRTRDDLAKQLQADINAWTKQLSQNRDGFLGTPQLSSTLVNPPAQNTIEEKGTFAATTKVKVTVLFVRNTDLQAAAANELDKALAKEKDQNLKKLKILVGARTPIKLEQIKQNAGDATTLDLTFKATGQAGPDLPIAELRDSISGKTTTDAHTFLQNSLSSQGVSDVVVQNSPSVFPLIAPLTDHINLIIQPEQQTTNPQKK